jgi:hypothetical protein
MPTPADVIFSPMQCISCNGISGGWNTVQLVTKSVCEGIGGSSSVQYGSPEDTVGACGQALMASNCNEYFAYRSLGGIPIQVIKPMVSLGGGSVSVNACNVADSDPPGAVPVYYDSLQTLQSSCTAFSALHPELTLCLNRVDQYSPVTIPDTDTTIDSSSPNTVISTAGPNGLPPPIVVGGASAAAQQALEKLKELEVLKNGMEGGNLNKVPTSLLEGILQFLRMNGLSTFMIMPIIPEIPALGGGQTASTGTLIIIAYNDDLTESTTITLQIGLS